MSLPRALYHFLYCYRTSGFDEKCWKMTPVPSRNAPWQNHRPPASHQPRPLWTAPLVLSAAFDLPSSLPHESGFSPTLSRWRNRAYLGLMVDRDACLSLVGDEEVGESQGIFDRRHELLT